MYCCSIRVLLTAKRVDYVVYVSLCDRVVISCDIVGLMLPTESWFIVLSVVIGVCGRHLSWRLASYLLCDYGGM